MEGIGVLHQEFTGAHDAEAWTDLVTEFGLDLVIIDGQLFVTVEFPARQVGDNFFVRRTKAEIPLVTIADFKHLWAKYFPATGFLPEFRGLYCRHQYFQSAGAVHFLANDGFNLA